jgi:hypothetical protein
MDATQTQESKMANKEIKHKIRAQVIVKMRKDKFPRVFETRTYYCEESDFSEFVKAETMRIKGQVAAVVDVIFTKV